MGVAGLRQKVVGSGFRLSGCLALAARGSRQKPLRPKLPKHRPKSS